VRIFVSTNEKGGVGKSAVADQFAWYLAEVENQRTLFLDFDQQGDGSRPLKQFSCGVTASQVFTSEDVEVAAKPGITLIAADRALRALEMGRDKHGLYVKNLKRFLERVSGQFDFCVIDTPPDPGFRMTAALVVANYVASPIELAQESVEGVASLMTRIQGVKAKYNPDLVFLGLLPNRVKPTPLQKEWFGKLVTQYQRFMVDGMARIAERSAIAEAQQAGVPVWRLDKSAARDAGKELKAVFAQFVTRMGGING
jgi:chromosome partitioning protein